MTGSWSIDVPQSVAVLRAAMSKVEGTESSLQGVVNALAAAQAAVPGGVVVEALSEVLGHRLQPDIEDVLSRTGRIFTSTALALSYYQSGDLDMAATAQRSAATAGVHSGYQRPLVD